MICILFYDELIYIGVGRRYINDVPVRVQLENAARSCVVQNVIFYPLRYDSFVLHAYISIVTIEPRKLES